MKLTKDIVKFNKIELENKVHLNLKRVEEEK